MTTLTADMGGGAALTANMGKGSSLTAAMGGGSSLTAILGSGAVSTGMSAEYLAVYNAMTTKPDAATAAIWNTCVEAWVANGEWATKDVIYVYAAHTNGAGEALINWKNPGTYNATAFNAPTFTADQGFLGNGSTQYINWNWNPSTHGENYTQNASSLICYIRTNSAAGSKIETGGGNASINVSAIIGARVTGDLAYMRINSNLNNTHASVDARGLWIVTRSGALTGKVYKNKLDVDDIDVASTGLTANNFYSLGVNSGGSLFYPTDRQVPMVAAGGAMTQTHVNNFCDPFNAAMTALGTNVY